MSDIITNGPIKKYCHEQLTQKCSGFMHSLHALSFSARLLCLFTNGFTYVLFGLFGRILQAQERPGEPQEDPGCIERL